MKINHPKRIFNKAEYQMYIPCTVVLYYYVSNGCTAPVREFLTSDHCALWVLVIRGDGRNNK